MSKSEATPESTNNSRKRPLSSSDKIRSESKRPNTIEPQNLFISDFEFAKLDTEQYSAMSTTLHLEQQIAKLSDDVGKMTSSFKEGFDALTTSVKECRDEVKSLNSQLAEACEQITMLDFEVKRIPHLESEIESLKKDNKVLAEKLLQQEVYSRRENLVFEKIGETQKGEDTFAIIHKLLEDVGLSKFKFHRCHRLGKFNNKKTRPILARFVSFQDKLTVLNKRKELKDKGVIIHDDFPQEISEKRAVLRPIFSYLKSQGEDVALIRDKLKFNDQMFSADDVPKIPYDLSGMCTKVTDEYVFFAGEYSCLSNFYKCNITVDEQNFIGSEQVFQYDKFMFHEDKIGAEKLRTCESNRDVWRQSRNLTCNEIWNRKEAVDALSKAAKLKYKQVPEFREFIQKHKDKTFVEATRDSKWGIGIPIHSDDLLDVNKWKGQNRFGKIIQSLINE